jgi:hypothetical protein
MHEIITLRHDDTSIAFDTTAATWSLTDLWRAAGSPENREPWNWARKEGKHYLEELARTLNMIWNPENLSHSQVFETRRGRGGGTWGHQLAGLEYARYLSPELSIACNQFLLDYWRGAHPSPAARVAALEQRVAALEQQHQHQPAQDTITLTFSVAASERISIMRELGGMVTPSQLLAELRQRGQAVTAPGIRQWLHRAARRGHLQRRQRGQYELTPDDAPVEEAGTAQQRRMGAAGDPEDR